MRVLDIKQLYEVSEIITRYEEHIKDAIQFPNPLIEVVKDWMVSGKVKVAFKYTKDDQPFGFAIIVPLSDRILSVYVDDLEGAITQLEVDKSESDLLDWCLKELENLPARVEIPGMTSNLRNQLLERGFIEYKRANMRASRSEITNNPFIQIPEKFSLQSYSAKERENVAEVIAKVNIEHVDGMIYPEYFSSKEAAMNFLEKYEQNAFGEYREGIPKILRKNKKVIGYCMLTVASKRAFVSDLGLLPEYQGRGLGKMLLVNSLLNACNTDESIEDIELAVTLSNPAKFLYEKIGFKIVEEFSSIVRSED